MSNLKDRATKIVANFEAVYAKLSDDELKQTTSKLQRQLPEGKKRADFDLLISKQLLPAAFAAVREAAYRELGYRHHVEQLMAGIALFEGNLVEMKTGEGKTLTVTAPAYLEALIAKTPLYKHSKGVHIITSNLYLARRDCETMGGIYARLGINCAVIGPDPQNEQWRYIPYKRVENEVSRIVSCSRKEAYMADIIYGTAAAFGFDYLRDNLVLRIDDLVQPSSVKDGEKLPFVIIDEADNVLLDEARTPLILSGFTKNADNFLKNQVNLSIGSLQIVQDFGGSQAVEEPANTIVPSPLNMVETVLPTTTSPFYYYTALVNNLVSEKDYRVDEGKKIVTLTDSGIERIEQWQQKRNLLPNYPSVLSIDTIANASPAFTSYNSLKKATTFSLYDETHILDLYYLTNCLKAKALYHTPNDYLVCYSTTSLGDSTTTPQLRNNNFKNISSPVNERRIPQEGEIVLIDKVTGRQLPGRRFQDGLHEALEAKHNLVVKNSATTFASITLQAYFSGCYRKIAGLSGTLLTNHQILNKIYGLDVVQIPTHRPLRRVDHKPPFTFLTSTAAMLALAQDALLVSKSGAPVLIGTTSVNDSETIAQLLLQLGARLGQIQVLNARQTEYEAKIIAQAGYPGRITVATNMAGRGTDIILGGRLEQHLADVATRQGLVELVDKGTSKWNTSEIEAANRKNWAKQKVHEAGGLHVLGLGLQASQRLDGQLIGRAGRQGDPGYSCFYYSLEDSTVKQYLEEEGRIKLINRLYRKLSQLPSNQPDKKNVFLQPLHEPLVLKVIEECQNRAEGQLEDLLFHSIRYDEVVSKQREVFYSDRKQILTIPPETLKQKFYTLTKAWLEKLVNSYINTCDFEAPQNIELHQIKNNSELEPLVSTLALVLNTKISRDFKYFWLRQLPRDLKMAGSGQPKNTNQYNTFGRRTRDIGTEVEEWGDNLVKTHLLNWLTNYIKEVCLVQEKYFGSERFIDSIRVSLLNTLDIEWANYLTLLTELRRGIGLRAYGKDDPLRAYQVEAKRLWEEFDNQLTPQLLHSVWLTFSPLAEKLKIR